MRLTKLLADETESRKDQNLSDDNSMRESVAQIIGQEMPEIWLYNLWNYRPERAEKAFGRSFGKISKERIRIGKSCTLLEDRARDG